MSIEKKNGLFKNRFNMLTNWLLLFYAKNCLKIKKIKMQSQKAILKKMPVGPI